jgi:hypothetical protein
MFRESEQMLKEAAVVCFKVIYHNLPGGMEKKYKISQPRQPVLTQMGPLNMKQNC